MAVENKKNKVLVCAFSCVKDPDRRFGLGNGGEGILGKNMVLQLSRFYDVFVLTHTTNKEAIESEKFFSQIKFYYINLPKFLDFTKKWIQVYAYLWQIKAYFVAKKINKEINFDAFWHVTYANDWMASYVGAFMKIPYIRGPGGGAHRVPKKFTEDYTIKERFSERTRSIGQWIFKRDPVFIIGQNRAKALLVCNREAFNALSGKWQAKAYLFSVNGVSLEDFPMGKNEVIKSQNKFSVMTAGKFIKIKGFDLAIKAFKIFSDTIKDAEFIVVGEGPEMNNFKNLAGELGIGEKVVFPGWMPRGELLNKMEKCDVFLFPSLRDGGGNVVVEAMASRKPVVCFDLAGPGFHIDESCGIKIKPKNPGQATDDMAKALEKLYSDKILLAKLGAGARKKVEEKYDWNKIGDRLNEICKKVL